MEKLYVVFSMDCERIASESPPGGPETWELSERSIVAFCEILQAAGFPPTLYVVPECGERHAQMLRELGMRGVDLGMHMHPQSFLDHRYDRCLGAYDAETQRSIIKQGAEMLTAAYGFDPTSFVSGNNSANDDTFPVLCELGFRQGSMSLPGRNIPEYAANWDGTEPFIHWASATDRKGIGALPFLELPVTTIQSRMQPNGSPYEMRIEFGGANEWHIPVLNEVLAEMEQRRNRFRAITITTHNFHDYADPDNSRTEALHGIVEHFAAMTSHEVVPVTMVDLRAIYVEELGELYSSTSHD
jgi:peptidoglycan/xylan/chitin deacetylase (PgdA/CDA1 family)